MIRDKILIKIQFISSMTLCTKGKVNKPGSDVNSSKSY